MVGGQLYNSRASKTALQNEDLLFILGLFSLVGQLIMPGLVLLSPGPRPWHRMVEGRMLREHPVYRGDEEHRFGTWMSK